MTGRFLPPDHGRTMRSPTKVDAFPGGASAFGALDMAGNVSQWTDEFRDDHTRAAILRGGRSISREGPSGTFRRLTVSTNIRNTC